MIKLVDYTDTPLHMKEILFVKVIIVRMQIYRNYFVFQKYLELQSLITMVQRFFWNVRRQRTRMMI